MYTAIYPQKTPLKLNMNVKNADVMTAITNTQRFTKKRRTPPFWHIGICPLVWWDSVPPSEPGRTAPGSTWQTTTKKGHTERERSSSKCVSNNFLSKTNSPELMKRQNNYQLWHIVDDDQVCPCVCWTEIAFIVHFTQLADPRRETRLIQHTPRRIINRIESVLTKRLLLWRVSQRCTATLPVYISTVKPCRGILPWKRWGEDESKLLKKYGK